MTNEEFMGGVDNISDFPDLSNKDPGPKRCKKCKRILKDIPVPSVPLGFRANPNRIPRGILCAQCMHEIDTKEDITIKLGRFTILTEKRSKSTWIPGMMTKRKISGADPFVDYKEIYDRQRKKHLVELVSDCPFYECKKEVDLYIDGKKIGSFKGIDKAEDEMWVRLGWTNERAYNDARIVLGV